MSRALILATDLRLSLASSSFLGLSVLERIIKNLNANGISDIIIATSKEDDSNDLSDDLSCNWIQVENDGAAIQLCAKEKKAPLWVIPADVIFHPQLYPRMVAAQKDATDKIIIAGENSAHSIILLPKTVDSSEILNSSLDEIVPSLVQKERMHRLSVVESYNSDKHNEIFVVPFENANKKRISKLLMKLNWRDHDGIIAALLNKHISVPISMFLVRFKSATPNMLTTVAFIIALVGIALTSLGYYWSFLLGALLVQIQSILDGCDGEIARLRYLSSKFGAWYDTVVDDLIGILWIAAIAIGMYRNTDNIYWLYGCLGAMGLYTIALSLVYITLILAKAKGHHEFIWFFEDVDQGSPKGKPDKKKISTWAMYVVRRDFYVLFFLILALVNLMPVVAFLSSLAAALWFLIAMIHISKYGLKLKQS